MKKTQSPSKRITALKTHTSKPNRVKPGLKAGTIVKLKGKDRYGIFIQAFLREDAVKVALPMSLTQEEWATRRYNLLLRPSEITPLKDQKKGKALLPKGFKVIFRKRKA